MSDERKHQSPKIIFRRRPVDRDPRDEGAPAFRPKDYRGKSEEPMALHRTRQTGDGLYVPLERAHGNFSPEMYFFVGRVLQQVLRLGQVGEHRCRVPRNFRLQTPVHADRGP